MTRRQFVAAVAGTAALPLAPAIVRGQSAGVIKFGHIQPLTGPSAAYGIRARDGAMIAVEEINAAGGWTDAKGQKHQLEMLVGDMANDPKQAITLFRQYATDSAGGGARSAPPIRSATFRSCRSPARSRCR